MVDGRLVYEVNARVWLNEVSRKNGREISLGSVSERDLDELAHLRPGWVWLMGVWKPSKESVEVARGWEHLNHHYRQLYELDEMDEELVIGSPYAVESYEPNPKVAVDWSELDRFRERLRSRQMGMILDFVPNHVAVDHPWARTHPEYFVQIPGEKKNKYEGQYWWVKADDGNEYLLSHGKDPHFPVWTDTLQLNYFNHGLREEMLRLLEILAEHCDGVRCDMAMLVNTEVFDKTWAGLLKKPVEEVGEFWEEAARRCRKVNPGFLLIAETYWGTDEYLLELGFDFVYDKGLYDVLRHEKTELVVDYLAGLTHSRVRDKRWVFIENHDEDRALSAFGWEKARAAAALVALMPGTWLVHQGQDEGREKRVPVQLALLPPENRLNERRMELWGYYERLAEWSRKAGGRGEWWVHRLPDRGGERMVQLVVMEWRDKRESMFWVVNYGVETASGMLPVSKKAKVELVVDVVSGKAVIDPAKPADDGLFVELSAWGVQVVRVNS